MSVLDVFDGDAFSFVSLTKAINQMSYVPTLLSSIPDLFEKVPVRTKEVWIERIGDQPSIIQSTARGSPPTQVGGDRRDARAFNTFRLALASKITSDELLGIRRFGSEIDLKDVQSEVARRWYKMRKRRQMTMEYHRFNIITQGKTLDADGTVIYDWTAEFAAAPKGGRTLTAPSEIAFNFAAGTLGSIRQNANGLVRALKRNLSLANGEAGADIDPEMIKIGALCGDDFYDALTTHPEVRASYLNWEAAAQLRASVGEVWRAFPFAGVNWINYRGTDDTTGQADDTTGASSTVSFGVGTHHCKFFPIGAGIFQIALAPGERFEELGSLGQEEYSMIVRDKDRDMWADVETYSYPLPVCTVPQALASGFDGT